MDFGKTLNNMRFIKHCLGKRRCASRTLEPVAQGESLGRGPYRTGKCKHECSSPQNDILVRTRSSFLNREGAEELALEPADAEGRSRESSLAILIEKRKKGAKKGT